MARVALFLFIHLLFTTVNAQQIKILQYGIKTNIRGLSVVDDNIAWASGSNGNIAITTDGGKTWAWKYVKGYELADFRDIEAFSATEAVIIASGSPALILKTIDGGHNWKKTYSNIDSAYFLDAMDFSDLKHGWVLGDPISNRFLLLETKDGGETWINNLDIVPTALPGEAAFAASGTCLTVENGILYIVTGGTTSRLLMFKRNHWTSQKLSIKQGKSSQGAFSISVTATGLLLITGGDYEKQNLTDSVACFTYYTVAKAPTMVLPLKPPSG